MGKEQTEESENLTLLLSSERWWGCRDRELWLPQLNLTQTSRHGKHPSDLPHLRLSSHYLQPLSLIWEGEKSTWHLQMAVIQCSEGSLPPPASLSLGNSLCHNEITSAAEWGVSEGWMSGEMLSQAGWAPLLPEFNIHVLHHLGCALAQASAPLTGTLGQVRGWGRVTKGPFCNGSAAGEWRFCSF